MRLGIALKGFRMVALIVEIRGTQDSRLVQGRSQGTTLSASARAIILNPFYNMEYKIINKT